MIRLDKYLADMGIGTRSAVKQMIRKGQVQVNQETAARPELKIDCTCRKPKPGMLLKAAEDFNIDLSQSWMVGDGENDIKAGYNAGCRTALIGRESYGQTVTISTLKEFVEQCLK